MSSASQDIQTLPTESSGYRAPFFLFNAHLETIYPAVFRKVVAPPYQRERITTPDQDFLDLDWIKQGSSKLVIIQHGLEGNTGRAYVRGMARIFVQNGYDALAWNYRGCGTEMNRQLRFYHSGATDDLAVVIDHAAAQGYESICLVGFSLGGNLTLKYLGENNPNKLIRKAAVFSVPVDLESSCAKISAIGNRIYAYRFLRSLKQKVRAKSLLMKGIDITNIDSIASLLEFDDAFTAPLHGFQNARDYYTRCSSVHVLDRINVPTLIVNTRNDPFLSAACFPSDQCARSSFVRLETPARGGHVGFAQFNKNGVYWSEQRALRWIAG